MGPTRRAILAGGLAAWPALADSRPRADGPRVSSLGLVIHSFAVRGAEPGFAEPSRFLAHARSLGARGIQVALGARDDTYVDRLRAEAEAASMDLEGIVGPPRAPGDLGRFEAEIRAARRAGASIVRTVMLPGRRYEAFDSAEAFRAATDRAVGSLKLAVPVLDRHDVRLAVENHKDWRADELLALLDGVGSDRVGVCLDTGNSLALLEDPMEVVEALAPRAFTVHLKDMGVEESPRGFRLAEVPLGEGVLDLPRVTRTLRAARPGIHLNLEMITRNPLDVPCLEDRYWATSPDLPARSLARALARVRGRSRALPRFEDLGPAGRRRAEDENIQKCVDYYNRTLSGG